MLELKMRRNSLKGMHICCQKLIPSHPFLRSVDNFSRFRNSEMFIMIRRAWHITNNITIEKSINVCLRSVLVAFWCVFKLWFVEPFSLLYTDGCLWRYSLKDVAIRQFIKIKSPIGRTHVTIKFETFRYQNIYWWSIRNSVGRIWYLIWHSWSFSSIITAFETLDIIEWFVSPHSFSSIT